MTNTENLDNLNPSDDDLLALPVEDTEDDLDLFDENEDEDEYSLNDIEDDRYSVGRNGMPSYSIYGSM